VLGWPAFAAGIVSALVDLDGSDLRPGRTPWLHSLATAVLWSLFGCGFVLALAPGQLAGAALAIPLGFGSHLGIDAFTVDGIFLWPRTRMPSDWLMPYRPESLVELDKQVFVAPSADGAVPRPWSGWRGLAIRTGGNDRACQSRAVERLSPHAGLFLTAASLAALLAAVILA